MDDVTVVITHYNNPDEMLRRAEASVLRGVPTIVTHDAIEGRADAPYLSWYDAVHRAQTEYVAILHDDDWYEPGFLERCRAEMIPECGFVFTDATIHFAETTKRNFPTMPDGYIKSGALAEMLRGVNSVISPSCMMARRADVLNTLLPGGVPLYDGNGIFSGPDALITMLLLIKYPCARFVAEQLVNFSAHEGSTTIHAILSGRGAELRANYDVTWKFWDAVKAIGQRNS